MGISFKGITGQRYYWQRYYSDKGIARQRYCPELKFSQYLKNLNTWDTLINKRWDWEWVSQNKLKWLVQRGHVVVCILDGQPVHTNAAQYPQTQRLTDRQTGQTDRPDRPTERPTDRQTNRRQNDRQQTNSDDYRQIDKQTDQQSGRTNNQTDRAEG